MSWYFCLYFCRWHLELVFLALLFMSYVGVQGWYYLSHEFCPLHILSFCVFAVGRSVTNTFGHSTVDSVVSGSWSLVVRDAAASFMTILAYEMFHLVCVCFEHPGLWDVSFGVCVFWTSWPMRCFIWCVCVLNILAYEMFHLVCVCFEHPGLWDVSFGVCVFWTSWPMRCFIWCVCILNILAYDMFHVVSVYFDLRCLTSTPLDTAQFMLTVDDWEVIPVFPNVSATTQVLWFWYCRDQHTWGQHRGTPDSHFSFCAAGICTSLSNTTWHWSSVFITLSNTTRHWSLVFITVSNTTWHWSLVFITASNTTWHWSGFFFHCIKHYIALVFGFYHCIKHYIALVFGFYHYVTLRSPC